MTTEEKLQIALGALADIGLSDDMTEQQRRHKAVRIYEELIEETEKKSEEAGV